MWNTAKAGMNKVSANKDRQEHRTKRRAGVRLLRALNLQGIGMIKELDQEIDFLIEIFGDD